MNGLIDFYVAKDGKECYIQVAYSVVGEKAHQREFSAFDGIGYRSQKTLITMKTWIIRQALPGTPRLKIS